MSARKTTPIGPQTEDANVPVHRRPQGGGDPFSLKLVEAALSRPREKPSLSLLEIARAIEPKIPLTDKNRALRGSDRAEFNRQRFATAKGDAFRGLRHLKALGRLEPLAKGEYALAGGSLTVANRAPQQLSEKAQELFGLLSKWEKDKPSPFLEPGRREALGRTGGTPLAVSRLKAIELLVEIIHLIPALAATVATRASDTAFTDVPALLLSGDVSELQAMLEGTVSELVRSFADAEDRAAASGASKLERERLRDLRLGAYAFVFDQFFFLREQIQLIREIGARLSNVETEHAFLNWGDEDEPWQPDNPTLHRLLSLELTLDRGRVLKR
jgi:hypothetical protein